jgi:hypothetical protein
MLNLRINVTERFLSVTMWIRLTGLELYSLGLSD